MNKARTVRISKLFLTAIVFLFALIIYKLCFVGLSSSVDGIDLKEFASNRNTKKEIITAERGTIFDTFGEVLAQNVNSYTVIAYLDPSRTTDKEYPHHVVDKEATAEALSPLINMTKERILELLNYEVYQVELGPGGRGLTELVKENIEALDLPGIDFIKSTKRYYPNGDFASYTLGYAKMNDEGDLTGEFGTELYYNDLLTGKNGYREYQQDMYGYRIANTEAIETKATAGNDIYLTIDTNIQMFVEQAITTIETASLDWATISVVDAKTGAILGVGSNPSFDPNIKDIVNYYDPFISYVYEPGSTMKTFSFMAAIENKLYNGSDTYQSGVLKIGENEVRDWNKYGWGTITYNQGYYASSNTAATLLAQKTGLEKLKGFYESLGFGKETGITLPNEKTGVVNFKYDIELANASFGQGMSVTALQIVQALTTISNDGVMIKPYIVDKIVNEGKIVYKGERTEIGRVASSETVKEIRDMMYGVVNSPEKLATGSDYKLETVNVIGKTGTAEIASETGGYQTGYYDYVRSFTGLFPYEDPQIIVYAAVSKTTNQSILPTAVKALMEDISTYLNITSVEKEVDEVYVCESFINDEVLETTKIIETNGLIPIVIGNGLKVVKQYPIKNTFLNKNDKVFLLTNGNLITIPNMIGWSRNDITNFANLTGTTVQFDGFGYATNVSVTEGSVINREVPINITLSPKYTNNEEIKPET